MSGNKIKQIKNYTHVFKHTEVGRDYFRASYPTLSEKLTLVNEAAEHLQSPEIYGVFENNKHYLDSVDALIASTYETEHRNEILFKEILPKIKYPNSFLDIGVGNGDLTKFLGQHFSKITVVDTQPEALKNIPDIFGTRKASVNKIENSVLKELQIFQEKYDLILVSHVLYYIPEGERLKLLQDLFRQLNKDGSMIVIYNSGGDRHTLNKHFNPKYGDFHDLEISFESLFYDTEVFESTEILTTDNVESMMHIAGVCLNDASANASREELHDYLQEHHHYGDFFQIDMVQNIIVISACNDC